MKPRTYAVPFILLALCVAALAAPAAQAHVESFSQAQSLQLGPYYALLEPRPTPPFANHSITFSALISEAGTGKYATDVPVKLVIGGPGGHNERLTLRHDGTGYHLASTMLSTPGLYSMRLLVENKTSGETYSADSEIEIYPDLPFRIRAVDQALDIYTGSTMPLAVEVVDPASLARKDTLTDLTFHLEHWSDDHETLYASVDVPGKKVNPGVWRIDHRFDEPGMYHLRFASQSGGFTHADVPILHMYATAPPENVDATSETPGAPALVAVLVALCLLALRGRRG